MKDVIKWLLDKVLEHWSDVWVLIFSLVALVGAVVLWAFSANTQDVATIRGTVGTIGVLLLAAVWWVSNRLPRAKGDKVAIVVAIDYESDEEETKVRSDFIESLRTLLFSEREEGFELLVYSRRQASRIKDQRAAELYQRKSRAAFIVWGRVRSRPHQGKEAYFAWLECSVLFSKSADAYREKLSQEMRDLLPQRVVLSKESQVFAFEAASKWLEIGARYTVGIAAMLSGDLDYAELQFLKVQESIPGTPTNANKLKEIKQRVPTRLMEVWEAKRALLVDRYVATRDREYVVRLEAVCQRILALNPQAYGALLAMGMAQFVLHRSVAGARAYVEKCRKVKDGGWRYSRAFLLAYEGKMDRSVEEYGFAFRSSIGQENYAVQCEEFIDLVLAEEQDRTQLNLPIGLINFHEKEDWQSAIRAFERFLETANGRWPKAEALATRLLGEARVKLAQVG